MAVCFAPKADMFGIEIDARYVPTADLPQGKFSPSGPPTEPSTWVRVEAWSSVALEGAMSSNWQPISTAPKDGTAVLTFQGSPLAGGKMKVALWRDDTVPKGWSVAEDAPAHWMPLPVPPNSTDQQVAD